MGRFHDYLLTRRSPAHLLQEISELFPKEAINRLFVQEIDRLIPLASSPAAYDSLERLKRIDAVAYVDRSVRRLGVRDPDLDEMVQQVLVKLLMGSFFTKWDKASPIDARFRVAVTNAIRTFGKNQQKAKRRSGDLPDDVVAKSVDSDVGRELLERFREHVKKHLGDVALRLLDHRLEGGQVKDLVGTLGLETSYRLKLVVQHLKNQARSFAADDPELSAMIERAFSEEAKTVQKRFNRVGT